MCILRDMRIIPLGAPGMEAHQLLLNGLDQHIIAAAAAAGSSADKKRRVHRKTRSNESPTGQRSKGEGMT
jgi:hypothetical protein